MTTTTATTIPTIMPTFVPPFSAVPPFELVSEFTLTLLLFVFVFVLEELIPVDAAGEPVRVLPAADVPAI